MTIFGKLQVTSKPPAPENDADLMADARKLAAVAKKMSKAEAEKWLVDEKTRSNGCFLFGAGIVSALAIGATLALAVFGASNISKYAHAIQQAKKYEAEYERTKSKQAFDAWMEWEEKLRIALVKAQEAAYKNRVQS